MNPYINLKSYTEANSKFFKGRNNEIEDVLTILKRSDVVVLYSESAEGKSSLLGAGLSPRLSQMAYIPVNIVFTDEEFHNSKPDFDRIIIGRIEDVLKQLNEEIIRKGAALPEKYNQDMTSTLFPPSFSKHFNESEQYEWVSITEICCQDNAEVAKELTNNAWWLLRNFAVERYAARFHFVLIFDQFEEVFSQPDLEWTNLLFEWLEQLYSDNCPPTISKCLLNLYPEEELIPDFNTNRAFKEIFSMRNEYIGDLDYWGVQKHFMPELKSTRYCLKPLTINEAIEVIDLGFKERQDVKEQILSAVTGMDLDSVSSADANIPRVQAMLLSIICSALSGSDIDSNYLKALKAGDKDVLRRIIYDVYLAQMRACKISMSHRKSIERALIDGNGKRVRIKATTPLLDEIDFNSRDKKELKRQGIIRSSKINGEEYVELVHDQLANAIYNNVIKTKRIRKSIVSVLLAMLTCIIVFDWWVQSSMSIDSTTIKSNELSRYSLALIDENIKDVVTLSGRGSLIDNSNVETYILYSNSSSWINIRNNKQLRTLVIRPQNNNCDVTIDIDDNLLLQKVIIADSAVNLNIIIQDNIGFCQIEIGKETKNIRIRPRTPYTEIKSVDGTYRCINNRWWNFIDSTLFYIPGELRYDRHFPFPFPINSVEYFYTEYLNVPQHESVLDLSRFSGIKEIKRHEFEHRQYDSVILPENLKEIAYKAFGNCKKLKQIVIPESVAEIDSSAFDDRCKVVFKRKFTNDEIEIRNDTTIKGLKLPQRRGTLDLSRFSGITEIGWAAFENSRYDSVILPENLKVIRSRAFIGCKNLKRIVIPTSVSRVEEFAFDDKCKVIFRQKFTFDEIEIRNDTTISGLRYPQRRGTLDLSRFSGITEIGGRAFFHSCYDSIILPENLRTIKYSAFEGCKNLKQIVIPSSVNEIDKTAFENGCEIKFKRDFSEDEVVISNDTTICGLKIPQRRGTLDLSRFPMIKEIGWCALESRYDSIIFPDNLKTISFGAFRNCKNLKKIIIPASVSIVPYEVISEISEIIFEKGYFGRKIDGIGFFDDTTDTLLCNGTLNLRGLVKSNFLVLPNSFNRIIIPSWVNVFNCSDIKNVYIENKSLSELIGEKKYIRIGKCIAKLPLENFNHVYCYNGTYARSDSLLIANDFNDQGDIYFFGRIFLSGYAQDSILSFSDVHSLNKIKSIHLSLPRPRVWTTDKVIDTLKSSIFTIDIPDSIKREIILYVPHGSKRFYEESLSFKAFKEIREDSQIKRYKDILYMRYINCIMWMKIPKNMIAVIAGILLVVVFFFLSFRINYKKRHPFLSSLKINMLSCINGIIMGIVAIMGFMATYWWIWDISHNKYFISAACGVIGAAIALGICYFSVFPAMWDLIRRKRFRNV